MKFLRQQSYVIVMSLLTTSNLFCAANDNREPLLERAINPASYRQYLQAGRPIDATRPGAINSCELTAHIKRLTKDKENITARINHLKRYREFAHIPRQYYPNRTTYRMRDDSKSCCFLTSHAINNKYNRCCNPSESIEDRLCACCSVSENASRSIEKCELIINGVLMCCPIWTVLISVPVSVITLC